MLKISYLVGSCTFIFLIQGFFLGTVSFSKSNKNSDPCSDISGIYEFHGEKSTNCDIWDSTLLPNLPAPLPLQVFGTGLIPENSVIAIKQIGCQKLEVSYFQVYKKSNPTPGSTELTLLNDWTSRNVSSLTIDLKGQDHFKFKKTENGFTGIRRSVFSNVNSYGELSWGREFWTIEAVDQNGSRKLHIKWEIKEHSYTPPFTFGKYKFSSGCTLDAFAIPE